MIYNHSPRQLISLIPPFSLTFTVASGSGFNSKGIGLRIQKKVLGKLSTKTVAKSFVDDNMSKLLDMLHEILLKELSDSKKADKVIKNLIKITVKIGILYRNDQFNDEEIALGIKLRKKLRNAAMTVVSFHQVDFSYDKVFLVSLVGDCSDIVHKLVERHLTAKSHQRINSFMEHFGNGELLDKVFLPDGAYHSKLPEISEAFDKVVEIEW